MDCVSVTDLGYRYNARPIAVAFRCVTNANGFISQLQVIGFDVLRCVNRNGLYANPLELHYQPKGGGSITGDDDFFVHGCGDHRFKINHQRFGSTLLCEVLHISNSLSD